MNSQPKRTTIIEGDFTRFRISKPDQMPKPDTQSSHKRISFFILGMVERVDFEEYPIIVFGRFDRREKDAHQIDLTDYGAVDRGISRIHCQLEYRNGQIIITDLGSTNGTYVGGRRLEPHQPYSMKRGEEFIIGRLPVQVVSGR